MSNIICLLLCAQTNTSNAGSTRSLGFSKKQILNFRSRKSRETEGDVRADRLVSWLAGQAATNTIYTVQSSLALQETSTKDFQISEHHYLAIFSSSQWSCTQPLTRALAQPGSRIMIMRTIPYCNYRILNKLSWEVATPLTWNLTISHLKKKPFTAAFFPGCGVEVSVFLSEGGSEDQAIVECVFETLCSSILFTFT